MRQLFGKLKFLFTEGMPKEPYKMVLVVRTDIPMGRGKIASQCAHAAVECFSQSLKSKGSKKSLDTWLFLGQPKIVLKVSSEESLRELAKEAKLKGLVSALIKDAGKTQLEPGTVSVLGIGPASNKLVDSVTSNLKLL